MDWTTKSKHSVNNVPEREDKGSGNMSKKKITGKELVNKLRKSDKYLISSALVGNREYFQYRINGENYLISNNFNDEDIVIHDMDCEVAYYGLDDIVATYGRKCLKPKRQREY